VSTLLDRERELAALDAMVADAAEGRGRLVVVEGPAGIGKSGLLADLRGSAGRRLRVLAARSSELEREFGFGVVRQLFEGAVAEDPAHALAGAAAPAAPLFAAGGDGRGDGEAAASFAALHGLYWLTLNLAAERPLLLAVDDLHWCDRASLRFLAYLARRLDGAPVLAAATLRSGEPGTDPALLAEIVHDPAVTPLRPGPLGPGAVAALVRGELGDGAEPAFCAACHEATGGNPLLLRQLLRTLEAEGIAPTARDVDAVRAVGPRAVASTVLLRLARLPADAAAVTRAAAVLGESAELPVIAALAGVGEEAVASATRALVRAEILRPEPPLGFVHPLVRDAVYHELTPAERALQHERAARVLREHGAPAEQVAAQLLMAPRRGEPWVAELLQAAGEAAARTSANESAVAYLARALEEPPPPERHDAVLLALGQAEASTDGPAAVEHLQEVYGRLPDPVARAQIALGLGHMLLFTDREQEAAALLRGAREDLPAELTDLRGLLHALELTTFYLGNADPGLREQLRAAGTRPDAPLTLADRARIAAASLDRAHRTVPADECAGDALAALTGGELIEVFQGGTVPIAPMMTLIWADREEGLAQLDALRAEAHRSGSLFGANGVGMWRSHALHARGDLAGAEEEARNTVENTRVWGFGDAGSLTFLNGILATILVARGDVEGARAVLGGPWDMRGHEGVRFWRMARLEVLAAAGEDEAAVAAAEEIAAEYPEVTNPAAAPWRSLVAPSLDRLGRRDEALARAREEVGLARAWGAPGALGRALRVVGTLDNAAGLAHLEEAVAVLDPSPARLELARALAALGAALRRERRPADAREPLRRALELAVACSATGLAEHVRTELYAAGARPRTDARSGAAALTASERRVASLAAGGETNRDIAQSLYVTPKTVEVHLSNAYRKLGIRSRRELAGALAA
jgi:DNA-binding CsgD family transcriptional regulator